MTAPQYDRTTPQYDRTTPADLNATGTIPAEARRTDDVRRTGQGLRVFQVLAGLSGAVLFVIGLIAVFRVQFDQGFLETSGEVGGFGFSPGLAIAAIILGGALMATAFADQDRGSTAVAGLVTVAVGIGALVLDGQTTGDVTVDRDSALLFVALGAIAFVLSLVPWWSRRQRVVHTETR